MVSMPAAEDLLLDVGWQMWQPLGEVGVITKGIKRFGASVVRADSSVLFA
jgi:hypothetical protein